MLDDDATSAAVAVVVVAAGSGRSSVEIKPIFPLVNDTGAVCCSEIDGVFNDSSLSDVLGITSFGRFGWLAFLKVSSNGLLVVLDADLTGVRS